MNKIRKAAGGFAIALLPGVMHAQLQVYTNMTPVQLVENVLVGQCVSISNITFNGVPNSVDFPANIGSFTNGEDTNLGISSGVVLSSGPVSAIAQSASVQSSSTVEPSHTSDPDLEVITGQNITNAAILEFDFIPNGDSISFRFVFGSEEYPEFVCSSFNDAFGFFLSGPGINGPYANNAINIALIPDSEVPVAVNTVNSGSPGPSYGPEACAAADSNWVDNSIHYVNNSAGTSIVYDGMTTVITARASVLCDEVYHIKLAIADASDTGWDSGVFLEAGSFSSVPYVPQLAANQTSEGNTIFANCAPVNMEFHRVSCDEATETETIFLEYGGSAVMGENIVPAFPATLDFEPGTGSMMLTFLAELTDGPEDLIITVSAPDCNGILTSQIFSFLIDEAPPIVATGIDTIVQCGGSASLVPTIDYGFPPFEITWNTGQTADSVAVSPLEFTTYTATITDTCGRSTTADFTVGLLPLPPMYMTVIGPQVLVEGCESSQLNVLRPYQMEGDLTVSLAASGADVDLNLPGSVVIPDGNFNVLVPMTPELGNAPAGGTVTIVSTFTDACGRSVDASVEMDIEVAPEIQLTGGEYFVECGVDSVPLSVTASGGFGGLTISWADGAHTGTDVLFPATGSRAIPVTATDICGNSRTAVVDLIMNCAVVIPNVFSPNGDNVNDIWEIDGIQYMSNTVRVYNRWGSVVYEATNYQNNWRGTDLPDGTYFYEVIIDKHEEPYNGHITIMREGS